MYAYILIGLAVLAIVYVFVKQGTFNFVYRNKMDYWQNTDYNNMADRQRR